MFITFCRRRLSGRVVPVALSLWCLPVLAVPLALCCCLAMAAEGPTHGSGHADRPASHSDAGGEACPHHDLAPAAKSDSSTPEAGCQDLDRLVIALAGLIGVAPSSPELTYTLSSLSSVSVLAVDADDPVFPVESPPPRA